MINIYSKITEDIKDMHWNWAKNIILKKIEENYEKIESEDIKKLISYLMLGSVKIATKDMICNEIKINPNVFVKDKIILNRELDTIIFKVNQLFPDMYFAQNLNKAIDKCKKNYSKEEIEKIQNEINSNLFFDREEKEKYIIEIRNKADEGNRTVFDKRIIKPLKCLKIVEKIFCYDSFSESEGGKKIGWGRNEFIFELGLRTCVYCNRQYITSYSLKVENKATADIDHFYIQSKYPYLAISLFNLIPSCQICNSRMKGDKDFFEKRPIFPYGEEFGDNACFETTKKNYNEILAKTLEFDVIIKTYNADLEEKIEMSKESFRLVEVYQSHKDYIREIYQKLEKYNTTQAEEYVQNFNKLFSTKSEFFRIAFGEYIFENDLSKNLLSKLTKDIIKQSGIETDKI